MIYTPFSSNSNYGLFYGEEFNNWKLNEIEPRPQDIAAVLDSVKKEFAKYLPLNYIDQKSVLVLPCEINPVSFRQKGMMFLSARGRSWSQYVYQFSHELLHILFQQGFPQKMKWFEESLCELASYFFLRRLSEQWIEEPPYSNWSNYAIYFLTYCNDNMRQAYSLNTNESFSDFIASKLSILADNPYYREVNALCAIKMLPIFEEHKEIWKEVLKLSDITDKETFHDFLYEWEKIADQKNCIIKIIDLFGYQ